jgi:hypothetical protein
MVNGRKLSSIVPSWRQLQKYSCRALVCVYLATLPLTAGCWVRWTQVRVYAAESKTDPASAYEKLLQVFAQKSYSIVEQRADEHYVKVRAHVDEEDTSHQSFIAAQIDAAGVVHFTPSGTLVRDDKIHMKLADEVLELESAMRGDVGPQSEPSASASAAPAPLPTETAAAPSAAPPPVVTPPPAPAPTSKPASKPKAATTSAPKATSAPKSTPAPKPTAKPSGDDWVPVQ